VIRKSEPQEKTAGGIIIPEVAKEKPLEGIIVAIGPGAFRIEKGKEKEKKKQFVPTVLKPGQHVIYQKYAEREADLGGETIVLVREEDILGIMEERSLVEKKTQAVETKKERPVAIREEAKVPTVILPPAAERKTPHAKKKPAEKKPAAKKTAATAASKTQAKKAPAGKESSAKKAVQKKTASGKPAAKKSAAKKAAAGMKGKKK
jgi:chaperonin GroES